MHGCDTLLFAAYLDYDSARTCVWGPNFTCNVRCECARVQGAIAGLGLPLLEVAAFEPERFLNAVDV